ncbi:MAG: CBS domain-containing protein [Gammaproteobacteria bacterium]|nr:CBS domain-containing protein [Gammaproteobacteria bacterium]
MNATLLICNSLLAKHPVPAARLLEQRPAREVAAFVAAADGAAAARTFEHMNMEHAAACLEEMDRDTALGLVGELHPDAQVAMLRLLSPETQKSIVGGLPPELSKPLERMLRYPKGTVGELMDPLVFTVPEDITVQETLKRARSAKLEMPFYVYVVDRNQVLIGVVSLKNLIRARRNNPITSVITRKLIALNAASAQVEMLKAPYWREFHTLPVTDDDGLFQGVVRYQTVAKLREELTGDSPGEGILDTALALGELYWMGLSGVLDGMAGRGRAGSARRPEE